VYSVLRLIEPLFPENLLPRHDHWRLRFIEDG